MFVAASLTILTVFALGCWPPRRAAGPWPPGWQACGVGACRGLLLGYALGLLTPSLTWLARGGWVAVAVCAVSVLRAARGAGVSRRRDLDPIGGGIAVVLLGVLLAAIMVDPIIGWDARSVWFFHAKILFYADHSLDAALWATPSLSWAHVGYPKLNAVWCALWMTSFASWNEYLPKFSLFLLELPIVLLCLGFSRATLTRILLLALVVLRMEEQLWNGYMDGLLASYAGLGMLYGIRYVLDGASLDLETVLVAAGICLGLKSEGAVLAACIVTATLLGRWWHGADVAGVVRRPRVLVTAGYALLGPLIWSVWKASTGMAADVVDSGGKLERLLARLSSGGAALGSIWTALTPAHDRWLFVLCVLAAAGFWLLNRQRAWERRASVVVGIAIPAAYFAILVAVYLSTPLDLRWHLMTSADRTTLPLHTCLVMGLLGPIIAAAGRAPDGACT
jgi:hypothetical protein